MEKHKKKIAEAPDGEEYVWVKVPGLQSRLNPNNGIIRLAKKGTQFYPYDGLRLKRTKKKYTHKGRRCLFTDMPVFEVEIQGESE